MREAVWCAREIIGEELRRAAQAHGSGSEQELLVPVVEALQPLRGATTLITADAGYQSEANLHTRDTMSVDALIADRALRKRDIRFATQPRHQQGPHPLLNKTASPTTGPRTPRACDHEDRKRRPTAAKSIYGATHSQASS